MRITRFLAAPAAVAVAAGIAVATLAPANASTAPAAQVALPSSVGQTVGHVTTGIVAYPDGLVAEDSEVPGDSPSLPKLPSGEQYSATVLVIKEIQAPSAPVPDPTLTPDSASGCTPQFGSHTCIYVNGKGLKVNYWTTGANLKKPPSNPESFYLINGKVRQINEFFGTDAKGFQIDPFGYENTYLHYLSGHPEPLIFGNNTKVCNRWTGAARTSTPCEKVHK